jgi:hypothetical protein
MSVTSIRRTLVFSMALALGAAFAAPRLIAQAPKEPETVILKGSPLGGVKFEHKLHSKDRAIKCTACHHASKPEKAMTSANQRCQDCHTKPPVAPMKTGLPAAFHDPMVKKGTCVDCHVAEVAKGKKAPVKCNECHIKANA